MDQNIDKAAPLRRTGTVYAQCCGSCNQGRGDCACQDACLQPEPATHAGPLVRSTRRHADGTGIVIGVIAGLALWAAGALFLVAIGANP